jgi:phosphatidylglycerophosphate synthase
MLSRWIRTWYGEMLRPFLNLILRLGITANTLTVASLIVVIIAGTLFALGQTVLGAWILLLGGFLDGIDGELARLSRVQSPFGAFLDSICDHCGDFAMYFGLLLPLAAEDAFIPIILIFVAGFASVFGSHVRSRAGMVGIDTKTIGLFTRCERIFVLFFGILLGQTTIALWILAIANSLSALHRVIYTIRVSQHSETLLRAQKT